MRPTLIVLLSALAVALLFGFIGQAAQSGTLYLVSGVGFLVAIGAAIALIPWVRGLPWPEKQPDLFPRLQSGERLDPITGERR